MKPKELARVWDDHNAAEFVAKDAELALKTMVEDPSVRIMANDAGGRGREQVRTFYAGRLIPQWPDDAQMQLVNRVIGDDQLVDELHLGFTHATQMDWLLPGVAPSNRKVEMDIVIVVQFRDGLIAGERIYWDHAAVLRQVGLLKL
jgi:carboxymethylenebutenolidase